MSKAGSLGDNPVINPDFVPHTSLARARVKLLFLHLIYFSI